MPKCSHLLPRKSSTRCPQDAPRRTQDGPIRTQDARKTPQDSPKTPPRRPKTPPRRPQDAPRKPQDAAKTPQDAPKTPQDAPRRPQDAPRRPQDAPRRLQTSIFVPRDLDVQRFLSTFLMVFSPHSPPKDHHDSKNARWRERGFAALKINFCQGKSFTGCWLSSRRCRPGPA